MEKEYKQELYVMVGVPGSGKSTCAEKLAADKNALHISSDLIRKELYGAEDVQTNPGLVFSTMEERALDALRDGKNVVYDATSVSKWERSNILALAKGIPGTEACVVLMGTPIDLCIERNEQRERRVPVKAIYRIASRYETPTADEGIDKFFVAYAYDKVVETPIPNGDYASITQNLYQSFQHQSELSLGDDVPIAQRIEAAKAVKEPMHSIGKREPVSDIER